MKDESIIVGLIDPTKPHFFMKFRHKKGHAVFLRGHNATKVFNEACRKNYFRSWPVELEQAGTMFPV